MCVKVRAGKERVVNKGATVWIKGKGGVNIGVNSIPS